MPTPLRSFRVADSLWQKAMKRALKEGVTLSEVIVDALRAYVAKK